MWWVAVAALAVGGVAGFGAGRRRAGSDTTPEVTARAIVDSLPSPILIVHEDGRVWHANPHGRAAGVTTGPGIVFEDIHDLVKSALATTRRQEMDLSARDTPARTPIAHVTATPLSSDLVLVALYDSGSALAMEAARRDFAVNVSHELKTPIGALSLLVEAMEAAVAQQEDTTGFLERMGKEVARLTSMVQQIIHLSRVQSTDMVVRPEAVELRPWLETVLASLHTKASNRKTQLVTDIADVELWADPELLAMAVRNVVDNAIQYSPPGSKVVVTARPDGHDVVLTVVDNGMGIPAEDLARIFERFYRADNARSRDQGGTGLGLSIVKHVVRQHGSDVQIWSKVGVGTTVTMRIPGRGADE